MTTTFVSLSLEALKDDLVEFINDENLDMLDKFDDNEIAEIRKLSDKICEFDGKVLVEDVYDCMCLPECEREESTIGGYVFTLLGRAPKVGDKVEDEYCHYEVISAGKMRVKRVKVTLKERHTKEEE